jgi:hypothetical protein
MCAATHVYCFGTIRDPVISFDIHVYANRLMQDNDSKHVSRSTVAFMEQNGITHWKTPASSPDLNPIENMWHQMKNYIRKTVKPRTKEELENGISAFWDTVTAELCNRYIDHVYKVLPVVVEKFGAASGY